MTITTKITPRKSWHLERDEEFDVTLDGGRRVRASVINFWPDDPDYVWAGGLIIRKDTGEPGSYSSRGWILLDELPHDLLVTIVKQWLAAGI